MMTELCLHVLALQDHRYRSCHVFAPIAHFCRQSNAGTLGVGVAERRGIRTCRGLQRTSLPSIFFWSRACRHHRVLVGVPRGSSQFLLVVPCHSLFALGLALGSPGVAQAHAVKHPKRTNMQVYHEHPSTLSVPLTLLLLVLSQICHRLPPTHTQQALADSWIACSHSVSLALLSPMDRQFTHAHTFTHTLITLKHRNRHSRTCNVGTRACRTRSSLFLERNCSS